MTPWKTFIVKNPKYPAAEYTQQEVFDLFLQAMIEFGWVLHDQISATQAVYKSDGEDGNSGIIYLQFKLIGDYVAVLPWLHWDEVNHAGYGGVGEYTTSATFLVSLNEATYTNQGRFFWSGNKDFVVAFSSYSKSGTDFGVFGKMPKLFEPDVKTKLTAPITPGTNITASLESSEGIKIGQLLNLIPEGFHQTPEHFKRVIGIPDATSVILDAVTGNFDTGDWLGVRPKRTYTNNNWTYMGHCIVPWGFDSLANLSSAVGYHRVDLKPLNSIATYSDPSGLNGYYTPSPAVWRTTHAVSGVLHKIGYDDEHMFFSYLPSEQGTGEFHQNIRYMLDDDEPGVVTGTISAATIDSITDSAASLGTDEHAGSNPKHLIYTDADGYVQIRKILSNTATKITTCIPFEDSKPPQPGLQYAIVRNVFRCAWTYGVQSGRNLWIRESPGSSLVLP